MTIIEFAELIGVSKSTVWRALHGASDIRPDTRDRILAKAAEVGYRPNAAARALVTGKSHAISLWVSVAGHSFSSRVVRVVDRCAGDGGYRVHILSLHGRRDLPLHELMDWPVDGVMLYDIAGMQEKLAPLAAPDSRKTPALVSIGVYVEPEFDTVLLDLEAGSRAALEHLMQAGRTRIAYVAPQHFLLDTAPYVRYPDARIAAYDDCMRAANREPLVLALPKNAPEVAREHTRDFIRGGGRCDAMFCWNDDLALGVYRGLRDAGVRIPDDIALVGVDGKDETQYLDCPLSTVRVPIEEGCQLGWEFLTRRMNEPDLPRQEAVLVPELMVRESSAR